jgi:putative phosphoesterase
MRIAVISDIHGNLPAVEAVLEEIRGIGVDRIVVGGDVLPGPMPRETLACLLSTDVPVQFIYGNGDRDVLERIQGRETGAVPERFQQALRWNAEQVRADYEQLLDSWPATLRANIPGLGGVLFCHATPHDDTGIFTRLTPDERLAPLFEGLDVELVVCGHTHMQFDRTVGRTRVVNSGSVGMPFGAPGADWLLLGPDVELRRTPYDLAAAAARIRDTTYPQAEEFVARYVLNPPAEAEMLALFSKADLK